MAKFIMWRKETGLSPVNQSQTFGVAWDDPATTAPQAFRFDICGSVSEPIPDNRYGVSNGELPPNVMPWPATSASWTTFHTVRGIIRHRLPASGEKTRKAPIPFHYTNLAERRQSSDWKRTFMCRWRDA
ncbi:GyrI-like domain-containing protein [Shigella flexneri]